MNPIIDLSDRLPLRRVWLIILAWATIALVQAITLYSQQGLRFFDAIVSTALNYSVMALLVWASCRLNVRWRLWSRPPLAALAAYLAVGLAGIVIWCTLELVAMRFWVGPYFWTIVFADTWMFQLLGTVFTYGAAFGLGLVVQTFDREHEARVIQIANTVMGSHGRNGTGRGLDLTRHRLRTVYGDERVDFRVGPDAGGFAASLDLPMAPHSA